MPANLPEEIRSVTAGTPNEQPRHLAARTSSLPESDKRGHQMSGMLRVCSRGMDSSARAPVSRQYAELLIVTVGS